MAAAWMYYSDDICLIIREYQNKISGILQEMNSECQPNNPIAYINSRMALWLIGVMGRENKHW